MKLSTPATTVPLGKFISGRCATILILAGAFFFGIGQGRAEGEPNKNVPINIFNASPAGSEAPPAGISASSDYLKVVRWTTFHKITHFPRGNEAQVINDCKLCADGSRIVFGSQKGLYVINPDGSEMKQITDKPPNLFDISRDGKRLAWFRGGADGGIFVANSDGSGKARLPGGFNLIALRMTADGSRLFVLCPEKGGIFMMAADGSDIRKLVTTADVCKLLGIEENGNHWRGNFDISDDGSRIVMHLLWDAFAANGDGSNLHRLTRYKDAILSKLCISADGAKVAHWREGGPGFAMIFSDFEGSSQVEFSRPQEYTSNICLSPDATMLAAGGGVRLYSADGKTFYNPLDIGPGAWSNPANLSLSANMKRGCFQIDGPQSVDQGRPSQLVMVDFNPAQLQGAPPVSEITASPRFALTDGSSMIVATAKTTVAEPMSVGATWIRNGERIVELNNWWRLHDDGQYGDEKAGDGIFTANDISIKPYDVRKPVGPGPAILRIHVMEKEFDSLTVVDLEGLEFRKPTASSPINASPAGSEAPPAGISASSDYLKVVRWTTFHKITHFPRGNEAQVINDCKLCADGSRIVFGSQKGLYVINPDGSEMKQITDKPPNLFDISRDGKRLAWFRGGADGGIFVANSDGSGKARLPGGFNLIALRMTADGSRLFVLCPEKGGIFMMAADGSDIRKLVTTADVCKLLGIEENGNHWRGNFDISDDGSRIVMHLLWDAFAANGDGSNLHRLTRYKDAILSKLCISADGAKVAHWREGGPGFAMIFSDFEGSSQVEFSRPQEYTSNICLSPDATMLAAGGGVRLYSADGKTFYNPLDIGPGAWSNPANLSLSANMKRGCFQIDGPQSVDQGRPSQLVMVDFNPAQLQGAPPVSEITASPRFALTDGSSMIVATAKTTVAEPMSVGATWIRNGERIVELNNWWRLHDDGQYGDEKAGDGIFTANDISIKPYDVRKPVGPGPAILRIHVMEKEFDSLTVVDLEGLEFRKP